MEKKLTFARAVLSFCAATMLLTPAVGPRATNMAGSSDDATLTQIAKGGPEPGSISLVGNAVTSTCPQCDPPPPDPGPIPIVGDPPKPKQTPPSVSIVPCMECEPRPIEGEPMPLPAPYPIKKPPVCLGCDPTV